MPTNIGYANPDSTTPLAPLEFDRAAVGPEDVRIAIAYCGICHSDIHQARDEYGETLATNFPCMPGHEIAGTVTEIGPSVTRYKIGDRVGVGCMVYWGSEEDRGVPEENYTADGFVNTYNFPDPETGEITFGGYSDEYVANEHFVLSIPDSIPLEAAAPLLCSGVTTWVPLRRWNVGLGTKIAIAGIGGLGHMAVQIAVALGADVTAITTTPEKKDAILALGAKEVIVASDEDTMSDHALSFDIVLSTIPTPFDMNPYFALIKHDGVFHSVGVLEVLNAGNINFQNIAGMRLIVTGSSIGSIAETQEILDFAAEHNIAPKIEIIPATRINEAFDKVVAKEVQFRYVLDNTTLRN